MAKVRKAVITAAGRGTRQYPATNTVQKELFPLVDVDGYAKPTVQIIVEEAMASGIEEICIVANSTNLPAMKAHFQGLTPDQKQAARGKDWLLALSDKLDDMRERLTFVVQETQEGYGHAVYQAHEFVGDEPFVLLLGDHVYIAPHTRCVRQALDAYERFDAPVSALVVIGKDVVERNGIVDCVPLPDAPGAYKFTKMVEKPSLEVARRDYKVAGLAEDQWFGFFGIHAMPPLIFDCLRHLIDNDIRVKNEIQFTSAMDELLQRVDTYVGCMIEGERYDMGVPEGFIETQVALALHSPFAARVHEAVSSK